MQIRVIYLIYEANVWPDKLNKEVILHTIYIFLNFYVYLTFFMYQRISNLVNYVEDF